MGQWWPQTDYVKPLLNRCVSVSWACRSYITRAYIHTYVWVHPSANQIMSGTILSLLAKHTGFHTWSNLHAQVCTSPEERFRNGTKIWLFNYDYEAHIQLPRSSSCQYLRLFTVVDCRFQYVSNGIDCGHPLRRPGFQVSASTFITSLEYQSTILTNINPKPSFN